VKRFPSRSSGVPTRQEVVDFILGADAPVDRREIARAFKVKGVQRRALDALLRELEGEGLVEQGRGRRVASPGTLPEVAVVDITGIDTDGELVGQPAAWQEEGQAPRVYIAAGRPGTPALAPGTKVLARVRRLSAHEWEAHVMRVLAAPPERFLAALAVENGHPVLRPTERRGRETWAVADAGGAETGDFVLAEPVRGRRGGLRQARVVERLGSLSDPGAVSLLAIHTHEIPHVFSPEALALAAAAEPVDLAGREDLRDVPLVTIDGEDARDFDDAVWAEPDDDPANPGGWHVLVAIADVSWYVRHGDALDRDAYERGNSVYFPDRVVPMLPEALSNELCSLRPGANRACLAAHMWFDAGGRMRRHRFLRGLMRSAARLTYNQVQNAVDGRPDDLTGPLVEPLLKPLYGAFAAMAKERRRRGTLELELPERRVLIGPDGKVRGIMPRERFDSHRLIEEFMIAANVAAAETLERAVRPCLFRVHEKPDAAKVESLRQFLAELGIGLSFGQLAQPKQFTDLLGRVANEPFASMVNELVLRSQAQAIYSPENVGHFGLALKRYAHFTSPIRRYADLVVHRSLVATLGLGDGGLPAGSDGTLGPVGEHVSQTERRAAAAERETVERFTALYLQDRVGDVFGGRVTGVTRFGLFVRLDDTGADGLVPIATLPADYYDHDEKRHCLVGRRTGRTWRLGETVEVRLVAAEPVTGGLVLQVMGGGGSDRPGSSSRPPGRQRPQGRDRGRFRR